MSKFIIVYTTTNQKETAEKLADFLLQERLSACVQIIGPFKSSYRWNGKIEENNEFMLIIKTKESLFKKVNEAIKSLHNYKVPEVLAVPIMDGNPDYLEWLNKETLNSGLE